MTDAQAPQQARGVLMVLLRAAGRPTVSWPVDEPEEEPDV
jgi:hypothetical protein